MRCLLAIDQGTTGTTLILFDEQGNEVDRRYQTIKQHYPRPGWVEHDPVEIWEGIRAMMQELAAIHSLDHHNLAGIGITNQRETVVVWDKETGQPVYPAIVWQCRRTADLCQRLKREGHEEAIRQKTGLLLDPYFSATKLKWILDNVPEARKKAARGELLCGTIDSWLIWKLTGGRVHVTDVSNASRTLLLDIQRLEWDPKLCRLFEVPMEMLPDVRPSSAVLGVTQDVPGFPSGVPIGGCAGDQQAALFGQACFYRGMIKTTYGTGAFLLLNTGRERHLPGKGLLSTVAWAIGDLAEVEYAVEGSVFIAGAAIQWLRDELGILKTAAQSEGMALSVPDTGGVYFVPAFVGLGAPYWDPFARGTIVGLTRGTRKEHLVRAALEAIAYQVKDVVDSMAELTGIAPETVRVDGGGAANRFLVQFQADILGMAVERPKFLETTALGAAYLAGLAVGVWQDQEELSRLWQLDQVFRPEIDYQRRRSLLTGWRRAVERAKEWEQEDRRQ
ncbi:MAG TPA: glycerol kinase GlpK [Limnochordia bacterium]|nr:glycerol kinase GlpK [Limnochordia bacterium]